MCEEPTGKTSCPIKFADSSQKTQTVQFDSLKTNLFFTSIILKGLDMTEKKGFKTMYRKRLI